jgi:hypothetical protein
LVQARTFASRIGGRYFENDNVDLRYEVTGGWKKLLKEILPLAKYYMGIK